MGVPKVVDDDICLHKWKPPKWCERSAEHEAV